MKKDWVIDRYLVGCLHCNYIWETRYPRVPAICPCCKKSIFLDENHRIIKEIGHNSNEIDPAFKMLFWVLYSIFAFFMAIIIAAANDSITLLWVSLIILLIIPKLPKIIRYFIEYKKENTK